MAGYRIEINRNLCMGAGECVYSAPQAFALDEDEKAIVLDASAATDEQIETAVRGCPNFAIRTYRVEG